MPFFASRAFTISRNAVRMQCFVIVDIQISISSIYIHTNEYVVTVIKSSKGPPFHSPSILKYKNLSFSPCYSCHFFAQSYQLSSSRSSPVIIPLFAQRAKCTPSRDIPGRERSRITYISPTICRRARIRTIESGRNNSRTGMITHTRDKKTADAY